MNFFLSTTTKIENGDLFIYLCMYLCLVNIFTYTHIFCVLIISLFFSAELFLVSTAVYTFMLRNSMNRRVQQIEMVHEGISVNIHFGILMQSFISLFSCSLINNIYVQREAHENFIANFPLYPHIHFYTHSHTFNSNFFFLSLFFLCNFFHFFAAPQFQAYFH